MPSAFSQTPPGFYFTRDGSRTKVAIKFSINSAAQDDVKARYVYDYTSSAWENKTPVSFSSRVLVTTRLQLSLDDEAFVSSSPGTQSQGKLWKAVRLIAPSTIERTPGSAPTGSPAVLTRYSIPVPSWVSKFVFAHSVYEAISAHNTIHLGVGEPEAGDIIAFISPSGKTIPCAALEDLLTSTDPPSRESGIRPVV